MEEASESHDCQTWEERSCQCRRMTVSNWMQCRKKEGVRKGESSERISCQGQGEHCQLCFLLRTEVGQ